MKHISDTLCISGEQLKEVFQHENWPHPQFCSAAAVHRLCWSTLFGRCHYRNRCPSGFCSPLAKIKRITQRNDGICDCWRLSPWTWQPAALPIHRKVVSQWPSQWWCSPVTRCLLACRIPADPYLWFQEPCTVVCLEEKHKYRINT